MYMLNGAIVSVGGRNKIDGITERARRLSQCGAAYACYTALILKRYQLLG